MLSIISLIITAITATVQAYSSYQSNKAAKREAEFNADMARANAEEAERSASSIRQQGEWERRKLALETLEKQGKSRTAYAASGVALGAGTPNSYEADIKDAYELDLRQLDYDISMRAYQAEQERADYLNQASMFKAQAGNFAKKSRIVRTSLLMGTPVALN